MVKPVGEIFGLAPAPSSTSIESREEVAGHHLALLASSFVALLLEEGGGGGLAPPGRRSPYAGSAEPGRRRASTSPEAARRPRRKEEEAQAQAAVLSLARPSTALLRRLFSSTGHHAPLLLFTWSREREAEGERGSQRLGCSTVQASQECGTRGRLSQNEEIDAVTVGGGTVAFRAAKCRCGHR